MKSSLVLQAEFSSAHFYHQPQWSDEKNLEVFGRCFTKYGHGHNYKLIAEFANVKDSDILMLQKKLNNVVSVLDHEHLNFVIPEFKNKIPTTEVILEHLNEKIRKNIPDFSLVSLELFETEDIGAILNNGR